MNTIEVNADVILENLRQVIDPEINCNIVDLGLVYSVAMSDGVVTVVMTLTTPGCPMHETICWGVKNVLMSLPGVLDVEVELVWDPPWHPSMMTPAGRQATGASNF
ncbi:MAG TPA: metal-sulfur cluster assembly factor [Verrucomicrobiae bacterium]|nr:metal-sulfur cluster assembly factor [Verrucomicrobiae bacterium]